MKCCEKEWEGTVFISRFHTEAVCLPLIQRAHADRETDWDLTSVSKTLCNADKSSQPGLQTGNLPLTTDLLYIQNHRGLIMGDVGCCLPVAMMYFLTSIPLKIEQSFVILATKDLQCVPLTLLIISKD